MTEAQIEAAIESMCIDARPADPPSPSGFVEAQSIGSSTTNAAWRLIWPLGFQAPNQRVELHLVKLQGSPDLSVGRGSVWYGRGWSAGAHGR